MLYRGGSIRAFDSLNFDASEVNNAFKAFCTQGNMGKVTVSFEDDESLVKVSE